MSLLFGPMRQIGFVVRDIEKAMRHWIDVNRVGPWFYAERFAFNEFSYQGRRNDGVNLSVALANCGDMQLELIQPRDDTPSMWRDFLQAGHEGMQHFAVWPEDYDALYRRALEAGFRAGQEGDTIGRGRFVYFENEAHPGTVVEILHFTPMRQQSAAAIREAALRWDGSEPVRRI
jgi:hypothetical protein